MGPTRNGGAAEAGDADSACCAAVCGKMAASQQASVSDKARRNVLGGRDAITIFAMQNRPNLGENRIS
jgi:hypothetical protein